MTSEVAPAGPAWLRVARTLSRPKVSLMLMLGFSSGLPFMLVGNTLGFWLREGGMTLSAIGFLSWVGLAYSLKFLWAPLIDRSDAPLAGRWLGRRRGWMLLAQLAAGGGLAGMALLGIEGGALAFGALALLTAFASATQDVVIDAWRIESADGGEELGLLTAAYQLGYRGALLLTDALILIVAGWLGWEASYAMMAAAMGIGVIAVLLAREPRVAAALAAAPQIWSARGLFDAIAGPFIAFFRAHGRMALLMLAAISIYRVADFVMGPMANPFYADLGLSKQIVGAVRSSMVPLTIAGVAAGGLCAVRFGFGTTLIIGAIVGPASNLAFTALALSGPDLQLFAAAMAIDNFSTGFAGTALVAYMSSLTSLGYTATQYALLSSFYALLGKALKGFSGVIVEQLQQNHSLMQAYALFFAGTAAIGIPVLLLVVYLIRATPRPSSRPAAAV